MASVFKRAGHLRCGPVNLRDLDKNARQSPLHYRYGSSILNGMILATPPDVDGQRASAVHIRCRLSERNRSSGERFGIKGHIPARQRSHLIYVIAAPGYHSPNDSFGLGDRFRCSFSFWGQAMQSRDDMARSSSQPSSDDAVWPVTGDVLIVDDLEFIRDTYRRQLERIGCQCHVAASHDEALAAVQKHEIAVVILDFDLGGDDPAPFVQQLHQLSPQTVIVGNSGYNRREEFAKMGVNFFLLKPWDLAELLDVVQRARSSTE